MALNLSVSSSSDSALTSSSEDISEDEDLQIRRIFEEEIFNCEMLDGLPPTPLPNRPPTRPSSVLSMASSSVKSTPRKYGYNDNSSATSSPSKSRSQRDDGIGKQLSEKEIWKLLELDMDEDDYGNGEEEKEVEKNGDKIDVFKPENIFYKHTRLRKRFKSAKNRSRQREEGENDNLKNKKHYKPRRPLPLGMTSDDRCAVLNDDVVTVRNTQEAVNALVKVLEKTKIRLINDEKSLTYTEPPLKEKTVHVTTVRKSKPQSNKAN